MSAGCRVPGCRAPAEQLLTLGGWRWPVCGGHDPAKLAVRADRRTHEGFDGLPRLSNPNGLELLRLEREGGRG